MVTPTPRPPETGDPLGDILGAITGQQGPMGLGVPLPDGPAYTEEYPGLFGGLVDMGGGFSVGYGPEQGPGDQPFTTSYEGDDPNALNRPPFEPNPQTEPEEGPSTGDQYGG